MCGLVGFISKNFNGCSSKEKDIFEQLLFIDTLRGDDSTGIFRVDLEGNVELAKEATQAPWFLNSEEAQKLMNRCIFDGAAMFGHNRKATKGTVNDENAHPFVVDDRIVLLHNGTLYGDHKKIADVDVDSHAIAHLIHENNDDVEAALRQLNGAYALIWYDVQQKAVKIIRNDARPLFTVETSTAQWFASEPGMLSWILTRNQQNTTSSIAIVEAGHLLSFTRSARQWTRSSKKLDLTKKADPVDIMQTTRDMCGWAGDDMYGCGQDNWENTDNDNVLPASGVIALPASNANVLSLKDSSPNTMHMKVFDGEPEMAKKQGCVMSVERFQDLCKDHTHGGWINAIPFDYEYVRDSNKSAGVFVYATGVDQDSDVMLRVFLAYDPTNPMWEQDLLNIVTQGHTQSMKIYTRAWHSFKDKEKPEEGFGVVYCNEMAPLKKGVVH